MPSSGKIELDTHLLEAKLAEFLAVYCRYTFTGGWPGGWVAGSIETKAISASNLKLKLNLTEAELGKK